MPSAFEVAAYLNSITNNRIFNIRPVRVTIGREVWGGASYCQYHEDEQKTSDRRFYLIGEVPKAKQRRESVCFPYDGSDWYIGGGYTPHVARMFKQLFVDGVLKENPNCPFGHYFSIHEWDLSNGEAIDKYSKFEYHRHPMTVEFLD